MPASRDTGPTDFVFQPLERFFAFLARNRTEPQADRRSGENHNQVERLRRAGGVDEVLDHSAPLFAFRIGQPGISLGLFEGALIIVCAAVMQAAIVPITGKLLDYPGLIMAFLSVLFVAIGYLSIE